ncbi:MAG: YopX family protein, partial [Clostridia bacterium]|nr:YopX family protein [Clostridia bacterium]
PDVIAIRVNPESVGQYICSYKDNKKEIYENDIFGITNKDSDIYHKECRIVKFIKDGFYLVDNANYGDHLSKEISVNTNYVGIAEFMREHNINYDIIGNMFDNSELI